MITKNYIKMCEKAEEIQAWKPKKGDFYAVIVHGKPMEIIDIYINGFPLSPQRFVPLSALYIWLPTQEQLQEMILISKKYDDMFILNNFLCDFMIDDLDKKSRSNMNELWLAFVMKEKWNKTWDGEIWK